MTLVRRLWIGFALVSVLVIAGGILIHRDQEEAIRREVSANLEAIARLKAAEIARWRDELLADGAVTESPLFVEGIEMWRKSPDADVAGKILVRLRSMRRRGRFAEILLTDEAGSVLLRTSGSGAPLDRHVAQHLEAALAARRSVLTDLKEEPGTFPPHLEVIAPLVAGPADAPRPVGAIVFLVDARDFLYPFLSTWPGTSATAETFICERAGGDALVLSPLHDPANAALRLRIPLSQADAPAVRAVRGETGVVGGWDHQGVEVLAAAASVPRSNWFLVAKVHAAEALGGWRSRSGAILAVVIGLLLAAAGLAGTLWQRDAKARYRSLLAAETARQEAEALHRATLLRVGEAERSAERALQTSEERALRWQQVFESAAFGLAFSDPVDNTFVEVNPSFASARGYSPEELAGRDVFDVYAPEARGELAMTLGALRDSGHLVFESVHQRKDGSRFPVLMEMTVLRDVEGRPVSRVAYSLDISDRKRAEEALRASEERFRRLLRLAPLPLCVVSSAGTIEVANDRFLEVFGYTLEDVPTLAEWWPRAYPDPTYRRWVADTWDAAVRRAADTGRDVEPLECQVTCKDGTVRDVVISGITLKDGLLATFLDVTERRHAEAALVRMNEELEQRVRDRTARLEAANGDLEAFSYSVSHDLRAPLRAIDGFVGLLREDLGPRLDAEGQRLMTVISDNARRMARLIDGLLSFSRTGRVAMQTVPVDVDSLAREAFREATTEESRARVELRLATLPEAVGDPTLLRQVFANLLSNAVKYSSRRERPVVEVFAQTGPEGVVYLVRDNGIGFDMAYSDKLFGVFQRLHSPAEYEGIGVGLALVKRIVERHNGWIRAESAVERGATFRFTLGPAGSG